jgi:hypothetical protein
MMTMTQIASFPPARRRRPVAGTLSRLPSPDHGPLGDRFLADQAIALWRTAGHRPPPPSPAKYEAGKRRLMALAAQRRDARTTHRHRPAPVVA